MKALNVPNLLTILRILLIPVFVITYLVAKPGESYQNLIPAGILVISGLTDMLDGNIARKFSLVTGLGRFLDPLADKLTLGAVCICLAIKYWNIHPSILVIMFIFIAKEVLMSFGTLKLMESGKTITSAMWFGKLGTVVFYAVMLLVVAFPQMPYNAVITMVSISAAFMVFAFIKYISVYKELSKKD
jgi:cardiolipin synthase (CMP-forming)